MIVSLGGIALSDHLTLDIGPAAAAISQRRLIGGASCVQVDGSSSGRVLTLAGANHWTFSQVERVRSLESIGVTVELVHHRGTFQVMISSTSEVSLTRNYANPPSDSLCSGSITLIEV